MPTNANAYNSRVTDEALEKRFRDTFRAQGGAELVDDLYAQGVIVPVVDFTSAATGSVLGQNLQTAWDFTTGFASVNNTTTTLISNAGFWQVDLNVATFNATVGSNFVFLDDGTTQKTIWRLDTAQQEYVTDGAFVVFVRSGDSLKATAPAQGSMSIWYRQIADVSGNLVNPSGFTSS